MFDLSWPAVVMGGVALLGLLTPVSWLRSRPLSRRLLLGAGIASLIWGIAPSLLGGSIQPLAVAGAVVAFGFLILVDLTDEEDSRG